MNLETTAGEFAQLAEALQAAPTPVRTAEAVVAYAQHQLDADYAGITLLRRGGRLETIAATDPVVEKLDGLQHELDEGPCRDSSWRGPTLAAHDLADEVRWPRWAPRAVSAGIVSVLATELSGADGRRIGALNLFWGQPRTFTGDDVAYAHIFTRHAALALATSLQVSGLNVALDSRKLIGQAQGILMERHRLDEAKAFAVLERYSQDHNLKLRQVAEHLVASRELPPTDGVGSRRIGAADPRRSPERS